MSVNDTENKNVLNRKNKENFCCKMINKKKHRKEKEKNIKKIQKV